jgi:hypothetical protein
MSDDDDHDDGVVLEEFDPSVFEDVISQRAIAFVYCARFAQIATDQVVKDLTYTIMRKISMSIKTPSTADLRLVDKDNG